MATIRQFSEQNTKEIVDTVKERRQRKALITGPNGDSDPSRDKQIRWVRTTTSAAKPVYPSSGNRFVIEFGHLAFDDTDVGPGETEFVPDSPEQKRIALSVCGHVEEGTVTRASLHFGRWWYLFKDCQLGGSSSSGSSSSGSSSGSSDDSSSEAPSEPPSDSDGPPSDDSTSQDSDSTTVDSSGSGFVNCAGACVYTWNGAAWIPSLDCPEYDSIMTGCYCPPPPELPGSFVGQIIDDVCNCYCHSDDLPCYENGDDQCH